MYTTQAYKELAALFIRPAAVHQVVLFGDSGTHLRVRFELM